MIFFLEVYNGRQNLAKTEELEKVLLLFIGLNYTFIDFNMRDQTLNCQTEKKNLHSSKGGDWFVLAYNLQGEVSKLTEMQKKMASYHREKEVRGQYI